MCSGGERKNGEISRQPQGREGLVKITFLEIKATESRIIQVLATAARFVRSLGLLKKTRRRERRSRRKSRGGCFSRRSGRPRGRACPAQQPKTRRKTLRIVRVLSNVARRRGKGGKKPEVVGESARGEGARGRRVVDSTSPTTKWRWEGGRETRRRRKSGNSFRVATSSYNVAKKDLLQDAEQKKSKLRLEKCEKFTRWIGRCGRSSYWPSSPGAPAAPGATPSAGSPARRRRWTTARTWCCPCRRRRGCTRRPGRPTRQRSTSPRPRSR